MVKVTVPATSANMGSGFDSIGIALNLYNTISFEPADTIEISDAAGGQVPQGPDNLIYACAKRVYDICGKKLTGIKIVEQCAIPQTRGLGSSSACTVAGLLGANALLGNPLDQQNILDLAASIEGHPDNSTPAILGGFCVALLEYGKVWSVRVPINGKVDFITFVPRFTLSTEKARGVIPQKVSHHDAVFNLTRAALLAGSLTTGKLENIGVAVGDRLHQPYRFDLIPDGREIIHAATEMGALGAFISGAGPSIIAIVDAQNKTYLSRAQMYCAQHFPQWDVIGLHCDEMGASVVVE